MTFLISWKTKDHTKTIPEFKKHGSAQAFATALGADGLNVKQSWHVVGEPRGVLVVEAASPKVIHSAMVKVASLFDVVVDQVLTDAESVASL